MGTDSDEIRLSYQEKQLVIVALLDRASTLRQLASGRSNPDDARALRDEATKRQLLAEKLQ